VNIGFFVQAYMVPCLDIVYMGLIPGLGVGIGEEHFRIVCMILDVNG
jgi:hypothetical protein